LSYLAFILATGLYLVLGPGGLLHKDSWYESLKAYVGESEGSSLYASFVLVIGPAIAFALIYHLLGGLLGSLNTLLVGTAALFFAFGREDFPTLSQRFLSRVSAGDHQGGAMILEESGVKIAAEDADQFADQASEFFLHMAMRRWFGPAIYFVLLGPVAAVAYRLVMMAENTASPVPTIAVRLIDWLPSRLLAVSFAIIGDAEQTAGVIKNRALDFDDDPAEFLSDACRKSSEESESPEPRLKRVFKVLENSLYAWLAVISLVTLI